MIDNVVEKEITARDTAEIVSDGILADKRIFINDIKKLNDALLKINYTIDYSYNEAFFDIFEPDKIPLKLITEVRENYADLNFRLSQMEHKQ